MFLASKTRFFRVPKAQENVFMTFFTLKNNRELAEQMMHAPHPMGGKAIVAMHGATISMHGETNNSKFLGCCYTSICFRTHYKIILMNIHSKSVVNYIDVGRMSTNSTYNSVAIAGASFNSIGSLSVHYYLTD